MLISEKSGPNIIDQIINFIPITFAIILAGISMWLSSKLVEKLSMSLLSVIQRVFGLLLGALAIEYVISGIKNTFGLG
jgi:multiple antibiotic resistance protein